MNTPRTLQQALQPTDEPGWVLDQHGFDPLRDSSRESRFAVSNGFLGVRGGRTIDRQPGAAAPPRSYVAGLFDTQTVDQPMSALVPVPDWLRVDISLASPAPGAPTDDASFHRRTLDFKRGALFTESRISSTAGLQMRLRVLRVVSLHSRAVGLQVIVADVDAGHGEATLEASFECVEFGLMSERLEQDFGVWRTNATDKRLAIAASASLLVDGRRIQPKALGPFKWAWTWTVQPGQTVHFERIVALVRGDASDGNPGEAARTQLASAADLG